MVFGLKGAGQSDRPASVGRVCPSRGEVGGNRRMNMFQVVFFFIAFGILVAKGVGVIGAFFGGVVLSFIPGIVLMVIAAGRGR